jgi:MT0933-like antitoxin protein
MGLLDKAKGLVEGHKDQIQQGLDKAKQTVNKAGESVNRSVGKRLPNTGTMTPVGQSAPVEPELSDEVSGPPAAQEADPSVAGAPPPGSTTAPVDPGTEP